MLNVLKLITCPLFGALMVFVRPQECPHVKSPFFQFNVNTSHDPPLARGCLTHTESWVYLCGLSGVLKYCIVSL